MYTFKIYINKFVFEKNILKMKKFVKFFLKNNILLHILSIRVSKILI